MAKKVRVLARVVYDAYPNSDLLPINRPRKNETVVQWIARCPEIAESIGDGLFSFLLREIWEGAEGELEESIRVIERAARDVHSVYEALLDHQQMLMCQMDQAKQQEKACSRKKPGKK